MSEFVQTFTVLSQPINIISPQTSTYEKNKLQFPTLMIDKFCVAYVQWLSYGKILLQT